MSATINESPDVLAFVDKPVNVALGATGSVADELASIQNPHFFHDLKIGGDPAKLARAEQGSNIVGAAVKSVAQLFGKFAPAFLGGGEAFVSRIAPPLAAIPSALDGAAGVKTHDGHRAAKGVGGAVGSAGGVFVGGFLGSFIPIPVVGTFAGAMVGGWVGNMALGNGADYLFGKNIDIALNKKNALHVASTHNTHALDNASPHPEPGHSPDIAQRQADKLKASQDLALINYVADSSSVAALSPPPNGHKQVVERA